MFKEVTPTALRKQPATTDAEIVWVKDDDMDQIWEGKIQIPKGSKSGRSFSNNREADMKKGFNVCFFGYRVLIFAEDAGTVLRVHKAVNKTKTVQKVAAVQGKDAWIDDARIFIMTNADA